MKTLLSLVLRCVLLGLVFAGAVAQADELSIEGQGSSLDCLTTEPDAAPMKYPDYQLERKHGALVRLKITFTGPTLEPVVEVVANTGVDVFANLAKRRASNYRLPCMAAGAEPIVTRQLFSFDPTDGRPVSWSGVERDYSVFGRCVALDGERFPWRRKPRYPQAAMRRNAEGTVLARMTFHEVGQAPEVQLLFEPGDIYLAEEVKRFLSEVRATCLPNGEAFSVRMPFGFRIEGRPELVLRDLTLKEFLQGAEPSAFEAPSGKVRFDLSDMGCPFDVRLKLYQPYLPNAVGEIGAHDARRTILIDWLKGIPLALKKDQLKQVIGGAMTISVPCGVVDLT